MVIMTTFNSTRSPRYYKRNSYRGKWTAVYHLFHKKISFLWLHFI